MGTETRAAEIAKEINNRFDARLAFKLLAKTTDSVYEELIKDFAKLVAVKIEYEIQQELTGFDKEMQVTETFSEEDIIMRRTSFSEKYSLSKSKEQMMWGRIEAEAKKQTIVSKTTKRNDFSAMIRAITDIIDDKLD